MISFNEVKEKIEKMGYYATNELLYDTYNALALFNNSSIGSGQDIFAICLEGPPGAGKTEFAKTYTKLANELFKDVELIDYQCDATTGKTELFEDINISAAIRGDADNVNIPGKLVNAIKKVNSGKRVVLFIDEYDKAREETDAFLLQFLQSGKINSTQHGDLEIKDEYKSNLQVILCKNDMREELSGPLSRRIRIIRLDYMQPTIFYKVADRVLMDEKDHPVNEGLLNLVSLMYEKIYSKKDMYNRLPSCSEMLIAIEDADRLLKLANAPQSVIYNVIVRNMLKSQDDILTFENSLKKDNSELKSLIDNMKKSTEENGQIQDLSALFACNDKKLSRKIKIMEDLIEEYTIKFAEMEEARKKAIDDEVKRIRSNNGHLLEKVVGNNTLVYTNFPDATRNFGDESSHIKRGYNIFDLSDDDWYWVAETTMKNLSHDYVINKLVENASDLDIKIYENGILLKEDDDGNRLIAIDNNDQNCSDDNSPRFTILSNTPFIRLSFVHDINNFFNFVDECGVSQNKLLDLSGDDGNCSVEWHTIDTLAFDDTNGWCGFDPEKDKLCRISLTASGNLSDLYEKYMKRDCNVSEKVLEKTKKIMSGRVKESKNE